MSRFLDEILLFGFTLLLAATAYTAPVNEKPLPRTVLALYDSTYEKEIQDTRIHRFAEMPLNHLGLVVNYHDINEGLPLISQMEGVRGVLTWFQSDAMADPTGFLSWSEAVINAGKRFVLLGELSASRNFQNVSTPISLINRFLAKLGLRSESDWTRITYDAQFVYKDPTMVEFERQLRGVMPAFERMKLIDSRAKSCLIVRRGADPKTDSHLVVIGPNGGYAASGYTHYSPHEYGKLQWYLNPFEFFRLAFATDHLPKPDVTTLSGRRIFYSQVDGDGWRNLSEITRYKRSRALSAEVILKEIIEVFSDLPLTVAPIVADIDPDWYGSRESLQLAKSILAIPYVEAGSHTYSHPLDWGALASGGTAGRGSYLRAISKNGEANADSRFGLSDLGNGVSKEGWQWQRFIKVLADTKDTARQHPIEGGEAQRKSPYQARSYTLRPFDLTQEIGGSISFINSLLPSGKRVEVLQWSGDTMPFEEAIAATRAANVRNINGGDTRFDREYPSYAWVAPLGRQVGSQRQIYASNSNENTYTDLWKDRYFGFKHLVRTIRNTEVPLRIKPLNVYYHMYSGQKLSSLNAVLDNLRYARAQQITPITASNYAAIADGFYTAEIIPLGPQHWRIEKRGALQSIRFDQATFCAVDFARSRGIISQQHYQGSLYVGLDAADPAPVIALKEHLASDEAPKAGRPYLIHARWQVWNLRLDSDRFSFSAQGFGPGDMVWKVLGPARFEIQVSGYAGKQEHLAATAGEDGVLRLALGSWALKPVHIAVARLGR